MDDMNGMTCVRIIRKQDKLVNIIFLTSSTDYVYEGYEVNATGYLVKPIKIDQLARVMERAIAQNENAEKKSILYHLPRCNSKNTDKRHPLLTQLSQAKSGR